MLRTIISLSLPRPRFTMISWLKFLGKYLMSTLRSAISKFIILSFKFYTFSSQALSKRQMVIYFLIQIEKEQGRFYFRGQYMIELHQLVFFVKVDIVICMFKQVFHHLESQQNVTNDISNCTEPDQIEEAVYLETIRKEAQKILTSLFTDCKDCERKFKLKYQQLQVKVQEKSLMLEETIQMNNTLKNDNCSLTLNLQQMGRNIKRNEFKQEILLRQIEHLKKMVVQKEAIIKYLQEKNQIITISNSRNLIGNKSATSINLDKSLRTCSQKDLSFARLKQTNSIKFEDYNFKGPLKSKVIQPMKSFGNRTTLRIKDKVTNIQLSQVKENIIVQNEKNRVDSQVFNSFQINGVQKRKPYAKTLSRKMSSEMTNSFWNYATNCKHQNANEMRKTVTHLDFSHFLEEVKKSPFLSRCNTQS